MSAEEPIGQLEQEQHQEVWNTEKNIKNKTRSVAHVSSGGEGQGQGEN